MKVYLVTIKRNGEVIAQRTMSDKDALNLVRNAFAKVYEETSADLKAIHLFGELSDSGKAKAIEYNSTKMIIQEYKA